MTHDTEARAEVRRHDGTMEPMYDLSDYPDDMSPECENCASTINVTYGPDPYALEINDDDSYHWLCKNCIQESADDI